MLIKRNLIRQDPAIPRCRSTACGEPRKAARRSMKLIIKCSFYALLVVGTLSALCWPVAAQVKVWQGTLTLPAYEEGPPDPNPPFDRSEERRVGKESRS